MKITTQHGKNIEIFIQCVEFSSIWLRVGKILVGFSATQLRDADLAMTRIEVITGCAFEVPFGETIEQFWAKVVAGVDAEYQQSIQAAQPRRKFRAAAARGK
jgi:hypothetical protein